MKFFVGIGEYRLDMAHCRSLKDKRQTMKSVLDRLSNRRGMAACEVGANELWKSGSIAVVCVSRSYGGASQSMTGALRVIESSGAEVLARDVEIISPEDLRGG